MANANTNRFFPIFQDGEDSAPAPSGSNSQSKKPAAKRSRQETPSPPHAPAVRVHTPAQLVIEAPPATSEPLTELAKVIGHFMVILERFKIFSTEFGKIFDELAHAEQRIDDFDLRLEELEVSKDVDPASVPAPAPCAHEEIIAALQRQVETLTAQVTALTARPAPVPAPVPDPAPVADHVLSKKVETLMQQVAALAARPTAPTMKPNPPAATTAKPARAATGAKPASAAAATPATEPRCLEPRRFQKDQEKATNLPARRTPHRCPAC
jgi:hypothetical protein